jgi:hypothetical protein
MAAMFRTIEKQGGSNGPEWLSSHPNPGNRSEYITKEAESLRVENPTRDSQRFERVKAHLAGMPKAPTSEEAARTRKTGTTTGGDRPSSPPRGSVPPPSSRYRQYTAGNVFRVSVPSNWRPIEASSAVTYAPEGAYGSVNGQSVFTHGVEIGVAGYEGRDLQNASEMLIDSLARGNPNMRTNGRFQRTTVAGQEGLVVTLDNVSEVTRQREVVEVRTTQLRDGRLLYAIAVAPEREASAYAATFDRVLSSLRLLR